MSCNDNQILHVIHDGNYIECRDSESNWQGYHFGSYASCNGAGEWSTDILNGCPDSGWNYLCGYETGEHWDCLLCGYPAGQMAYSGEGPWPESPYYDFWCEDIASPPKTIGKESIKRQNELLIRSGNTGKTPRNPVLNSSRSECPTGYMMRNGICSESSPSRKPIHHNIQKGKQDWDNMIGEYHSNECCYPPNPGNCVGAQYLVNIHCNQWEGYWYGISQFSPTCGSCSIPDYEQMILSCNLSDPDSMSQVGNDCGDTKWCPCICTSIDIPAGEPGACEGPPLKSTSPPKLDFRRGGKVRRHRRR